MLGKYQIWANSNNMCKKLGSFDELWG